MRYIWMDHSDRLWPDALYPFALEERLLERPPGRDEAVVHLWRDPDALVLGLRDRKLQRAGQTVAAYERLGGRAVVRHSGGAAVPLNWGVLNVTMLMGSYAEPAGAAPSSAKGQTKQPLGAYKADFERMAAWIMAAAKRFGLAAEAGEVVGSYCPGDYDLSIDRRKFCGIAQRRTVRGSAVQAFIIVEGDGVRLGERARNYYERAAGRQETGTYPDVIPATMASIRQHADEVTVDRFRAALLDVLAEQGGIVEHAVHVPLKPEDIWRTVEALKERYRAFPSSIGASP